MQIPTGEKEADLEPEVDLPSATQEKVDIEKLYTEMEEDLRACESLQDVEEWVDLYKPQKPLLRKAQQTSITKLYNEIKGTFKEKVDG